MSSSTHIICSWVQSCCCGIQFAALISPGEAAAEWEIWTDAETERQGARLAVLDLGGRQEARHGVDGGVTVVEAAAHAVLQQMYTRETSKPLCW